MNSKRERPYLQAAKRYFPGGRRPEANAGIWQIEECPFCESCPAWINLQTGYYNCFLWERCEANDTDFEYWTQVLESWEDAYDETGEN